MIAFLDGRVFERGDDHVVVIAGGVGYRVVCTSAVPVPGAPCALYIHTITKETGTTLYGFLSREGRERFIELLEVKGVGPTTAMRIVAAGANPRDLAQLVAIKGVGKKIAETIVSELGAAP